MDQLRGKSKLSFMVFEGRSVARSKLRPIGLVGFLHRATLCAPESISLLHCLQFEFGPQFIWVCIMYEEEWVHPRYTTS